MVRRGPGAGAEGPLRDDPFVLEIRKKKRAPAGRVLRETDPASPKFVVTKRGMGYYFGG
ncbi:hypothetical protein LAWASA_2110 [Lawsonibacter asaccharolyticus]|nr:hypothetical protein LAWASA_2110 [Lawsonibacter asaccharolyticus]